MASDPSGPVKVTVALSLIIDKGTVNENKKEYHATPKNRLFFVNK